MRSLISKSDPTVILLSLRLANTTARNIASACAHDAQVETHHDMFPRWLYPVGHVLPVDPETQEVDEMPGLFHGHYLVNVCDYVPLDLTLQLTHHIVLSQILRYLYVAGAKKPRRGLAVRPRLPGITSLTPRMVAYGCCQVCLSCQADYSKTVAYLLFRLSSRLAIKSVGTMWSMISSLKDSFGIWSRSLRRRMEHGR